MWRAGRRSARSPGGSRGWGASNPIGAPMPDSLGSRGSRVEACRNHPPAGECRRPRSWGLATATSPDLEVRGASPAGCFPVPVVLALPATASLRVAQ